MSGLWDLKDIVNSPQNRSKNKLVSENSVTPAHENCSLRVPGGRGRWVLFSYRNWADSHDAADFALGCKTVGSFLKIGLVYVKSLKRAKRASLTRPQGGWGEENKKTHCSISIPGSFWPEDSKMSSSCQKSGAHPDGQQHGVSTQISINLGKTFLRISRIRNVPLTWILARFFAYLPPFISYILDFIYWMVLIFILIYFERRDTENLLVARVALGFESCGDCCIQQIQSSRYSVVSVFFNGTLKLVEVAVCWQSLCLLIEGGESRKSWTLQITLEMCGCCFKA